MIRNLVGKSSYKDGSFCPNLLTNMADTVWPNRLKLGLKLRGEFLKSANQKQESPVVATFVNGSGQNEQSL
jgi:hypothetical protein